MNGVRTSSVTLHSSIFHPYGIFPVLLDSPCSVDFNGLQPPDKKKCQQLTVLWELAANITMRKIMGTVWDASLAKPGRLRPSWNLLLKLDVGKFSNEKQVRTSILELRFQRRGWHWVSNYQWDECKQQIMAGCHENAFALCMCPSALLIMPMWTSLPFVLYWATLSTSVFLSLQFLAGICTVPALN